MDLAGRLQIKPDTSVAVLATDPDAPELDGSWQPAEQPGQAGAVIAFVRHKADVATAAAPAIEAARDDRLAWIAYPKAKQLGTDLNRDTLAAAAGEFGLQPVRQISIDDVWSALRFRPA